MSQPVLRPLALGEILDVAFGLYRGLFMPLLVITLATNAVPVALSVYIEASGGALLHLPLYFTNLLLKSSSARSPRRRPPSWCRRTTWGGACRRAGRSRGPRPAKGCLF